MRGPLLHAELVSGEENFTLVVALRTQNDPGTYPVVGGGSFHLGFLPQNNKFELKAGDMTPWERLEFHDWGPHGGEAAEGWCPKTPACAPASCMWRHTHVETHTHTHA